MPSPRCEPPRPSTPLDAATDHQIFAEASVVGALPAPDRHALLEVARLHPVARSHHLAGKDGVFLVRSGAVRLYLLSGSGREITVAHRRQGDIFQLEQGRPSDTYVLIAQADADGTVLFHLPWEVFIDHVGRSPRATSRFVREMLDDLRRTRHLAARLAFGSLAQRLAQTMVDLACAGDGRSVPCTQNALAALIVARPEQVSKTMRRFRAAGYVTSPPKSRPILLDVEALVHAGLAELSS